MDGLAVITPLNLILKAKSFSLQPALSMVIFSLKSQRIVLPSPRLNDSETLVIPTVIDHAKDGSIYAFKRQSLPKTRLSLYFEHMNRPKILELITFLKSAMGNLVQYIDYEGTVWLCVFITEPFDFTHTAIRNNAVTLEIEAIRA